MEHVHITEIKNCGWAGNNHHYKPHICHDIDCMDKFHCFELATMVRNPHLRLSNYTDNSDYGLIPPTVGQHVEGSLQPHNNYFDIVLCLHNDNQTLCPLHIFTNTHITFHLNHLPSFKQMTVDDVAKKSRLPDLHPALTDFIHHYTLDS